MASKRKAIASNQSKTRNATSKQTKNKVWTEEEVTIHMQMCFVQQITLSGRGYTRSRIML